MVVLDSQDDDCRHLRQVDSLVRPPRYRVMVSLKHHAFVAGDSDCIQLVQVPPGVGDSAAGEACSCLPACSPPPTRPSAGESWRHAGVPIHGCRVTPNWPPSRTSVFRSIFSLTPKVNEYIL